MRAHEGWQSTRKVQKETIADFMILMAVVSCEPLRSYSTPSTTRYKTAFESAFDALIDYGCTRKALETALQMSKTIRVPDAPSSKRVSPMVKRIRMLADELSDLEASGRLVWHNHTNPVIRDTQNGDPPDVWRLSKGLYVQAERIERRLRKAGRTVSPRNLAVETVVNNMRQLADEMVDLESTFFLAIQNLRKPLEQEAGQTMRERLYHRADDYEDWLRMASENVPPRSHSLLRVKRVCPVLYVKWATGGRCFYNEVRELLLPIIGCISAPQLSREVEHFETEYPYSADYIRCSLARVHRGEKTYQVLPVKPDRQSEVLEHRHHQPR
jgi:hypothetical protein